jgi:hypothetical protein
MLKTVPGTYKHGEVKLSEYPKDLAEGRVLVTFLDQPVENGSFPVLTLAEAAELRNTLAAWEGDWNAPGMEAYDQP